MRCRRSSKYLLLLPFSLILLVIINKTQWSQLKRIIDPPTPIDCSELFAGNENAILRAKYWRSSRTPISERITCDFLRENYRFSVIPDSQEEESFPLAAVILVHRNFDQFLQMFEAIYVPQNSYCISIDGKSEKSFQHQVESLANCFSNVQLSSPYVNVYWGHFSVLEAAVNCLEVLNNNSKQWEYVQILSWSDVPLKTNLDLVRIFKVFNGSNDVELLNSQIIRWQHPHYFAPYSATIASFIDNNYQILPSFVGVFFIDESKQQTPPGDLTIYKGSFSASLTRETVRFMFSHPLAQELYKWFNSTLVPDESYWSTIIHNPQMGIPGSFPGFCADIYEEHNTRKPYISRYDVWDAKYCGGKMIHTSCVFGVKDLPILKTIPQLVAHKVYEEFEPAAFHCMIELYWERKLMGRNQSDKLNMSYYENLPSVRHQNDKSNTAC